MKRRWFVLAALGLTVATLVGSAQPTTLTFWSWRVEDKAFYDDIAKQFEQKNGIKIEFEPYKSAEYPTILSSALAAGTGPDIIHTRAYGGLAQLADAGYLMPVDSKMIPALRGFSKTLMTAAQGFTPQTQNQVYGVPFATQTLGIYYNKNLLKKAGITDLPESWDEFKQTLQKVRAAGILPLGNGAKDAPIVEQMFGVVGPMFYGATGFFNGVVRGDKKFTDPLFVRAIRETAALKDFFPPNFMGIGEDEGRALFFNEQAAFTLAGSWNIGYFKQQNPKLDMGFMAAPPLQKGGLKYVSTFADGNYSINAKTKNKDAAVKFLNFLASKDFGQQFTDALAQASAVPGVSAKDPILQDVLELRAKHGTPYIMLVGFRYKTPTGSELLRNGIQRLMQGQGSAQQVAEDVQRGLATWYEPFKR